MKTSQSITNLSKALLIAQKQMGGAVKGAKNPFFKSNYADLPTVMEVVKEPLNDAGIVILQPASYDSVTGKNYITTTLIHADSGEWIQGETEVKMGEKQGPQDFGAAQTYARRFGLQSMMFIPSEDDDGNAISGRSTTKPSTKTVYAPPGNLNTLGTQVVPPNSSLTVSQYQSSLTVAEGQTSGPTVMGTYSAPENIPIVSTTSTPQVGIPTVVTLEPLKKTSSFSKKNKLNGAAPKVEAPVTVAQPDATSEWN